MSTTESIFKATRREGYSAQWQNERRRGRIEPMAYDHPTLSERLSKWWGGRHG